MSRIILHIGTHKTATTSIQKFLDAHRVTLADRGVFYPDYGIVDQKGHYAHIGMVNALSGAHDIFDEEMAKSFFAEVVRRSADYDTTIISAEPFYRHVLGDPKDGPPRDPNEYWPARTGYIEKIKGIFGEAQVVVVFRRQAEYAQSLYQEHVKATRYKGDFHRFLDEFWYHFAFFNQARAWDASFPGLKALTFDRLVRTGDAVGEFCRLLNLPVEGLDQPRRANEGLPVDLVVLKRMMNGSSADRITLRKQFAALEEGLSNENRSLMKTRSFFDTEGNLAAFQQQFAADNEELRRFLLHDDANTGPVFPTAFKPGQTFGDQVMPDVLLNMMQLSIKWIRSEHSPFRPAQAPKPAKFATLVEPKVEASSPGDDTLDRSAYPTFLLGIGPQHDGLSWLAQHLGRHPQFMPPPIEDIQYWNRRFYPEFFGADGLRKQVVRLIRDNPDDTLPGMAIEHAMMFRHEQYYRAFFEARLTEAHRAFGDFSPANCILSDQELSYVSDFMRPYRTRALFVMRDPVEQLWTRYTAQYALAKKRRQDFDPYRAFARHFDQPDVWARHDYTVTIANLDRAFSNAERHYVFFEDLAKPGTFAAICEFIGLDRADLEPDPFPRDHDELKRPSRRKWRKMRAAFAPVYEFVGERMGRLPEEWSDG